MDKEFSERQPRLLVDGEGAVPVMGRRPEPTRCCGQPGIESSTGHIRRPNLMKPSMEIRCGTHILIAVRVSGTLDSGPRVCLFVPCPVPSMQGWVRQRLMIRCRYEQTR